MIGLRRSVLKSDSSRRKKMKGKFLGRNLRNLKGRRRTNRNDRTPSKLRVIKPYRFLSFRTQATYSLTINCSSTCRNHQRFGWPSRPNSPSLNIIANLHHSAEFKNECQSRTIDLLNDFHRGVRFLQAVSVHETLILPIGLPVGAISTRRECRFRPIKSV